MKPLLAAKATAEDLKNIKFPVLVSPKIDGIRCLLIDGKPKSRTLKDIPNLHVQATLHQRMLAAGEFVNVDLDGELITYDDNGRVDDFSTISSKIMSRDGKPDFDYRPFDILRHPGRFQIRYDALRGRHYYAHPTFGVPLRHHKVRDGMELTEYADRFVADGYEGIMIRSPDGPYKFGRSTLNEGYLIKYKLFDDDEFEVIRVNELMRNQNEAYANEVGAQKRSTAADGLVPGGTMGTLTCKGKDGRPDFDVGTGFTQAQRDEWWRNRGAPGAMVSMPIVVKVKYQGYGPLGRPRFPVFLGIRDEKDV